MGENRSRFLPGVAEDQVLDRLRKAGGNEIDSGKLESPDSSAALAVNTLGWFITRPELLPPFPDCPLDTVPTRVDVEFCARFPWSGGRHPWLDAVVETPGLLIGVESKRFEPYRGRKKVSLSKAYDRAVWGSDMGPYETMRDGLRAGDQSFEFLDAVQLLKHAFGLVTEARRRGKAAVLIYLFAEPTTLNGRPIPDSTFLRHRAEIARFGEAVAGAAVQFFAMSYREWLATWASAPGGVAEHAANIRSRYEP